MQPQFLMELKEKDVTEMLDLAKLPKSGQTYIVGWTVQVRMFDRDVTVGIIYMLKLHHLS